ncbi:MAG: ATP-binding protein, partial [Rikenellaceae bacterium]
MTNLLERFQEYVTENALVVEGDKVLLTVSGGVDSMVLLDLCAKSNFHVGIAHCNFQLRGEESEEDEL